MPKNLTTRAYRVEMKAVDYPSVLVYIGDLLHNKLVRNDTISTLQFSMQWKDFVFAAYDPTYTF